MPGIPCDHLGRNPSRWAPVRAAVFSAILKATWSRSGPPRGPYEERFYLLQLSIASRRPERQALLGKECKHPRREDRRGDIRLLHVYQCCSVTAVGSSGCFIAHLILSLFLVFNDQKAQLKRLLETIDTDKWDQKSVSSQQNFCALL